VDIPAGDHETYDPQRLFERLIAGHVDLIWTSIAGLPGGFMDLSVFELPFMAWPAEATSQAALAFARDRRHSEEIQILLVHADAPIWLHMKSEPVQALEDLRGKRIYAPTVALRIFLENIGAEAVTANGLENVASMLGRGQLDGVLLSFASATPSGLAEATRYHTRIDRPPDGMRPRLPGLGTSLYVLAMNRAKFQSLPQDLRHLLLETVDLTLAESAGRTWDSLDRLGRRNAKVEGHVFHQLSESEHWRWRRAAQPVIDDWQAVAHTRGLDGAALLLSARRLVVHYYVEMAEEVAARTKPARDKGGP
jgi:TRAP-type C4-dicarboxylate transport system substrate-binding protein